jgi:type IV pilus assembly protein PilO
MSPAIDDFFERPLTHKLGLLAGIVLFTCYIFWQFFYKEPFEKLDVASTHVADLEGQIVIERKLSRDLPRLRKEVEALDTKLAKVLKQLPDKREIPELLSSISGLARESGLEVALFRPNPERIKDFYAEVPVSVLVEGTYHEIATFFDEVGRLSRIVNIDQISVSAPKVSPEKVILKADCSVTTFRFLDESERVQNSDKEESQKKKRR